MSIRCVPSTVLPALVALAVIAPAAGGSTRGSPTAPGNLRITASNVVERDARLECIKERLGHRLLHRV
jgi:hypothetical protein